MLSYPKVARSCWPHSHPNPDLPASLSQGQPAMMPTTSLPIPLPFPPSKPRRRKNRNHVILNTYHLPTINGETAVQRKPDLTRRLVLHQNDDGTRSHKHSVRNSEHRSYESPFLHSSDEPSHYDDLGTDFDVGAPKTSSRDGDKEDKVAIVHRVSSLRVCIDSSNLQK